MEQPPRPRYGCAAYRIRRDQKLPWTPNDPPISQADTPDILKKQLLVPPWEQVYELDVDALPSDVPNIKQWLPAKGTQIVVRVRDPGAHLVRSMDTHYQYFQVQLDRLPAELIIETAPPARPPRRNHKGGGRPKRSEAPKKLQAFLDVVEQDVKRWRKEPPPPVGKKGQNPTLEELYHRIVPQLLNGVTSDSMWTLSTFKRWGKDAATLAGYPSLKAFMKAIPH